MPADARVAVFSAADADAVVTAARNTVDGCADAVRSFSMTHFYVSYSIAVPADLVLARYFPSRVEEGLAACVMLGEVDAVQQGPGVLASCLLLHNQTASACGLKPLPLDVHIGSLVLRGIDEAKPVTHHAWVDGGELVVRAAVV